MKRTHRLWYLAAVVAALALPGVRWLFWQSGRSPLVDPGMARAGEVLFKHNWEMKDLLSPNGDGLGPVYNATSCVACHNQGGPGGGGGLQNNVTTFVVRGHTVVDGAIRSTVRQGVVHAFGFPRKETLADVSSKLPAIEQPRLDQVLSMPGQGNHCVSAPSGVTLSQRNTPALFGSKLIDDIPDRVIIAAEKSQRLKWGLAPSDDETVPVGRASRLGNGRIGRFGWKAQTAHLADFVQAACANELGLSNPGAAQPTRLYFWETKPTTGLDLTAEQCDQLTAFCASLSRPVERLPKDVNADDAKAGKALFSKIGCADCHLPRLGSVDGLYSDLLLHQMGRDLVGGGSYGEPPAPLPDSPGDDGPSPAEWRTPPLWGVADSAPYLHDGRAATLRDAILMHGGQGERAKEQFIKLSDADQTRLLGFLKTLRAP
jgi:CxxC motif-containing protein (DUF1111 family)